ncbi:unnamed protein product [Nezara viridula]|uniref:Peptidase S8/S53 domain-containing protein n=1 Tax=Nezara viridula TaxID=85310 RepID=A0A9P0H8N8_NEZVI|nr:unnamed protein product [Nezara viridula]
MSQPNASNGGAEDGLDMNVGPAWAKGYTGKGVVVSILDDGIQTNHPDLIDNYVTFAVALGGRQRFSNISCVLHCRR